ncbi:MAG: universal stress protein, partial [Miltoncostaeaceae bacterium]
MDRIICCLDTGPASAATLEWVRRLWPEAAITALHVAPPQEVLLGGMSEWEIDRDDPFSPPRRWLTDLATAHGARAELLAGEPWPAIRDHLDASDRAPDLVVAAAHSGRFARIALGSTATELAQHSLIDTLIVPPDGTARGPIDDIVCAIEEPRAAVAIAGARRLAQ